MDFSLGGPLDPSGERLPDQTLTYDPSDLTTHGVIVGMTGSGKTGLGIIFLEEALRQGIPTLVIDPKGDMTNLLLTFPELDASDFRPWIDEGAAAKDGRTPDQEAEAEAAKWKKGLGWWELSGTDIGALRDKVDMTIYTPGSQAGVPLNVVGELKVPDLDWETDAEAMRTEIQGFVSGLLGLVDIDADPIASREHILLSNLIEHSWRNGTSMTLERLIGQIVTPPIRKLGVFEVDSFFPEKDRMGFAMKLNGLLASPAFSTWMDGAPLDIESLLWNDGRPQASVIYLSHLSDSERQFIVTTLLSKLITWMRSQSGSSELRALVYMDEVFGFVPPVAEPPAKRPILTLLKQARAFGVGLLLSTQNPVDLDYKAMSNAGTWCIGRLQTERDKARILEALDSAGGTTDTAAFDQQISGLKKRSFLLHNTREAAPQVFTTRWAMSYLRGPMTREEIGRMTPQEPTSLQPPVSESIPAAPVGATSMPEVAEEATASFLHPAAPWAGKVGYDETGDHYEAAVAVSVSLRFDETRAGVDHTETWEAILHPLTDDAAADNFIEVDHDNRDFLPVEEGVTYVAPDAPISQSGYFDKLAANLKAHLDRNELMILKRNRVLKITARPGESEEDFMQRVEDSASDGADRDIAKLRDRYETKFRKAQRAYDDAVRDADTASDAVNSSRGEAAFSIGLDLLMGRKPKLSSSSNRTASDRRRRAQDRVESKRTAHEDLGEDLEDALEEIREKWAAKASEIDTLEIGLESDDIVVEDVRIVWIQK